MKYNITEIFDSIDGEGLRTGELTTFIRLAGCNLDCIYCDTKYSQKTNQGIEYTIEEILKVVSEIDNRNITITGGEPLKADGVKLLVDKLVSEGYLVNIETNGSIDIEPYLIENVLITMDYKCTTSGMKGKMLLSNLEKLRETDVLKFVIGEKDTNDVIAVLKNYSIKSYIYLSPIFNEIEPVKLVAFLEKLKHKGFDVSKTRIQLQLHKIIWGENTKGV